MVAICIDVISFGAMPFPARNGLGCWPDVAGLRSCAWLQLPAVRTDAKLCQRVQVIMADEAGPSGGGASENERLAAVASAATAAEIPQGGGTAARAAASVAGSGDASFGSGGGAPMVLRIRPSPNLRGPPPVFMLRAQGAPNHVYNPMTWQLMLGAADRKAHPPSA